MLSEKHQSQRLHTVWFRLYNIFEMTKFLERGHKQVIDCQGLGAGLGFEAGVGQGKEGGVVIKG